MKQLMLFSVGAVILFAACKNKGTSVSGLTGSYCDCLTRNKDLSDSLKIDSCDRQVLSDTLAGIESDSAVAVFLDEFDLSMKKDCKEYSLMMGGDSTGNVPEDAGEDKNWETADTAMQSKLTDAQCQEFYQITQFSYDEMDSNKTTVSIENGIWKEAIKDGKYYSKLTFKADGNCNFRLIYAESNDPIKSKRSKKGETYRYRVIDKKGSYYLVLGIIKGKGMLFKLYAS